MVRFLCFLNIAVLLVVVCGMLLKEISIVNLLPDVFIQAIQFYPKNSRNSLLGNVRVINLDNWIINEQKFYLSLNMYKETFISWNVNPMKLAG